jgi:hypothetical protein
MGTTQHHDEGSGNDGRHTPVIPDHQLLHRIGDGSYGEVWLARTATGTLRAIKIVHRARFKDARPYEREFAGLRQFEPVSRTHPGFVDILHLGRDDAAGCFYYIMELADADAPEFTPETYRPLTLESLIKQRGRLPVAECVRLSRQLAQALECLHGARLVHRDIKPGNIIFVGGVPKLADVGLVAPLDSARSFVGTEGFIPPEGPGTPQADLYSLGKVMYEMAMGKDRQEFPSPPTLLDELPDAAELLELNEVINRACDPEPSRRYRSAGAMSMALETLSAGKSIRGQNKRRILLRWMAASLIITALAGLWLLLRSPLRMEQKLVLPNGQPAFRAAIGDLNGDGKPEVLSVDGTGMAYVYSANGSELMRRKPSNFQPDELTLHPMVDVDGDGRQEVVVQWSSVTNFYISLFNQQLIEVERYAAFGYWHESTNDRIKRVVQGFLQARCFVPPKEKSPAWMVATLSSGMAGYPRELRCYDGLSTNIFWRVQTANAAAHVLVEDLDNDGQRECIVGFVSNNNRVPELNGEDDSRSRVKAISEDGRVLWTLDGGDVFTCCRPVVVRTGGSNVLYVLVSTTAEVSAQTTNTTPVLGIILRVSPEGKETGRYDAGIDLYSLVACDTDGDSEPEILATDGAGLLHVLDRDLKNPRKLPVAPKTHDWVELRLEPAADLNGDGRPELVFFSKQVEFVSGRDLRHLSGSNNRNFHELTITVLSSDLQRKFSRKVCETTESDAWTLTLTPPDRNLRRRIAVLSQDIQFYSFR